MKWSESFSVRFCWIVYVAVLKTEFWRSTPHKNAIFMNCRKIDIFMHSSQCTFHRIASISALCNTWLYLRSCTPRSATYQNTLMLSNHIRIWSKLLRAFSEKITRPINKSELASGIAQSSGHLVTVRVSDTRYSWSIDWLIDWNRTPQV